MNVLKQLFSDHRTREHWDSRLTWWRLRYRTAEKATHCLNLLSRSSACGRLALFYKPGEPIYQLYLGLPEEYVRLLKQMAANFRLSLQSVSQTFCRPLPSSLTAVAHLSWEAPFLAHLVNETIYINNQAKKGSYWPQLTKRTPPTNWHLPTPPPLGLTTETTWSSVPPPTHLIAPLPDPTCWPLGRTVAGEILQLDKSLNIYGHQPAVAHWLVEMLTQRITTYPQNLIVIDGLGDVVPQLKRKTAVTRQLGTQVTYFDLDNGSLRGGFNPLAPVQGESDEMTLKRWQTWFSAMNVHPQAISLLQLAYHDGIQTMPALKKWLQRVERRGSLQAVANLQSVLQQLTANAHLREWLTWPTNCFAQVDTAALLFTCQGSSWARRHLLAMALLSALSLKTAHLVLHGYPWQIHQNGWPIAWPPLTVITNGPSLPTAATILLQTQPQHIPLLASRFLDNNPLLIESLQLLQAKEGILLHEENELFIRWSR